MACVKMSRMRGGWLVGAMLVFAGCRAVGPDYVAPQPDTPGAYLERRPGTPVAEVGRWWESWNDPVLVALLRLAERQNLSLVEARSRVRQARAVLAIARGQAWPEVNASGQAARSRSGVAGTTSSLFSVGFDASWEIDVFGGIRRNVEAAGADADAAVLKAADVLISLRAEVATTYVDLRTLQRRLQIARSNIELQDASLRLADIRFRGDVSPELDVAQARANLRSTRASVPSLRAQVARTRHRLAVLLREWPADLDRLLSNNAQSGEIAQEVRLPHPGQELGIAVPAELLRRRPDVRAAERAVAAAVARIGVAQADLYPRFSLSGSFAFESPDVDDWIKSKRRAWAIGPAVSWNLFDRDRRRWQVALRREEVREAVARHERALRTAVEEVERSLAAHLHEAVRAGELAQAVMAARRSVELSDALYRAGKTDFQNVLDAQRTLFSFQDQLIDSRGAALTNLIATCKALGGAWTLQEAAGDRSPSEKEPE